MQATSLPQKQDSKCDFLLSPGGANPSFPPPQFAFSGRPSVCVAGKHGTPAPWYFPVSPTYWGCRKARKTDLGKLNMAAAYSNKALVFDDGKSKNLQTNFQTFFCTSSLAFLSFMTQSVGAEVDLWK